MSESVTISKKTPETKSLQYEFLREEAIRYIQSLAGKIWTDYNIHDPGITTLEVLCYAITELGYRANYPVSDLLENNPDDSTAQDIKNFYTAREILPNCPVTINDYRKLLIDVDVEDLANNECRHVGIKNAWFEKSKINEIPVYVHKKKSLLSYDPDPLYEPAPGETGQPPLEIGILYDILIEFEKCDAFGDLNENSLISDLVISEHLPDTNLNGLTIKIAVDFPRWDSEDTEWDEVVSIKSDIQKIILRFSNVPNGYDIAYSLVNNVVKLTGTITTASDVVDIPGLIEIENKVNDFIYYQQDSMLEFYRLKVKKIEEIIAGVKAKLHANRNLCEDFYKLNALKVEKIAVCADIELETEAIVEEVQASMYHEIGKFLSPTVHFYTLDEMLDKCKIRHDQHVLDIDKKDKSFTVNGDMADLLIPGDLVTISGSTSNDGDYTVLSQTYDADAIQTKVFVKEDIASDLLTENEQLWFYTTDESQCLTADEIFEGPALDHGFIDNNELAQADRKKSIHVSDLIQIIMDIPGVTAVKSIQIANLPQDNADGAIKSKSVKWCLQLAFEQNYVPRLSVLDSKVTFYKQQLPFRASSAAVELLMDELEKNERPAKLYNPVLDFEVPVGNYRDIEDYQSIQNEFPLTYGIGEEGFATRGNDKKANTLRAAQARQFKGFLMPFDQLLANYFAQLAHVKELFSMNAEKDEFGNYLIGRTYFTQPLFDIVPDADALYLDKNGHEVTLDNIAEDEALFNKRKNKFLDHLIGRFAETFTDYALLTTKLSGEQAAPAELIEDKLSFLNAYPLISSARGKGFNHQEPCLVWHTDNISGLRRRVSFLTGIDERDAGDLHYGENFSITPEGDGFRLHISDNIPVLLLKSYEVYYDEQQAALELEKLVVAGTCKNNYKILSDDGLNFYFTLHCRPDRVKGYSARENYTDNLPGGEADQDIDTLVEVFTTAFFNNLESNRNNLACPLLNYLDYSIVVNMETDPPQAVVSYNLFGFPLTYEAADKLLTGQVTVNGSAKSEVNILSVDTATSQVVIDGNIASKLNPGDVLVIDGSQDNDGVYTVQSATDVGSTTEIIVIGAIPSDTVPLGELLYNKETGDEMQDKAEDALYDIFWQLIDKARRESNYYFSSDSGAYRFRIIGSSGDDIGESVEADFNDPLADEISNLPSGLVHISGSSANNGDYGVVSAAATGAEVKVTVNPALPANQADGYLNVNETYAFSSDHLLNTFIVVADLSGILYAGDMITISGSQSVDGEYTLFAVDFDGAVTNLIVEETIPATDNTGQLTYQKTFAVSAVNGNDITFKGGYEHKTVALFIEFIESKFFSHEGFHVVEHVLLRPKVRGLHFVDADSGTLTEGLADNGSLYFNKTLPIFSASSSTRLFRVEGDISSEIEADDTTDISGDIYISDSGSNDGNYQVKNVLYDVGTDRTHIKTVEEIPADIAFSDPVGDLSYFKGTPVAALSASSLSITIADAEALAIMPGEVVEIRGSTDGINDGRYLVESINDLGAQQQIVINCVEAAIEDKLLDIVLDEDDCDACQIQDPYTCVASVILPHWPGRFDNMDFRRFFERQIRLEAPAHVFLNICWISCRQMDEFEEKFKAWLLENAKNPHDFGRLSARQNELINIINNLSNVYPSGTLHDCDEDETLENAIILNNSVLGNA